jgi:hypothetical protein
MRYSKSTSVLLACLMGLAGCATSSDVTSSKEAQPTLSAGALNAAVALKPVDVATAGKPDGANNLVIASKGMSQSVVVVSASAGKEEKQGADDLVKYIQMMTGAKVMVASTPEAIAKAMAGTAPVMVVGEAAINAKPELKARLAKAAKPNPEVRSDAIVLTREGNKVYVAGNNDEAHFFAVSQLLQMWGVRWYMATDIGECVPDVTTLDVGKLDMAYGSPFESRMYWIAWVGDTKGFKEFSRRNFMSSVYVPNGHTLAEYVKDVIPKGKTHMDIPISDPATAKVVADKVAAKYAKGEHVMMGIEDGVYNSDYKPDIELAAKLEDKYFQKPVLTDPFLVFYNNLARDLMTRYPDSKSKIGFLLYVNITNPPQRKIVAEKPLIGYLAPIDIDPTHGMDDPRSPARQEYRDMMYQWSKVMQGRVVIYDYDQGMLVWRDIPNPSHMAFRQDVKHYRDAGIMGVATESRGATGTIFTNLYFRGQLMWNPDADVDQMLAEFYPKFYGPAAAPMGRFWNDIYKAWEETIATEHEFFVAPAVYTPELIERLRKELAEAEALVKPLAGKANPTRNEKAYLERMKMARYQFGVLDNYMKMVWLACRDGDYKGAIAAGKQALKDRDLMTDLNGTFATYRVMGNSGWGWFPGEVEQYEVYDKLTNGTKGKLVQMLPLEWNFRRDPNDTGYPRGWKDVTPDMTYWNKNKAAYLAPGKAFSRKDYPTTEWEVVRSDIYAQAQGILHPDGQSFTGYMWYQTPVELTAADVAKPVHVMFPGLFSEAWLYVNGELVAYRPQGQIWWLNDYRFEWDVSLDGKLKAGKNSVVVRVKNTHHNGGMFRRPFLYTPVAPAAGTVGGAVAK